MNSFGRKYRVSIFGESHGTLIGVVIDGVPAGIALCEADLNADLDRRRAGANGTTPRKESDEPRIVSGVFEGHTTGAPLTIVFENMNTRSGDYSNLVTQPRPGHADFVAREKWNGNNDYRGGGHFSGRITLGIVAAGVVAKKILGEGISVESRIVEIAGRSSQSEIDEAIQQAIDSQNSLGGIVECTATGIPVGWGEPFFDSIESVLSHGLFSIPAIKGVEFGVGFEAAHMLGSEHNDDIIDANGTTRTNNAGGVNGGISNGNSLVFRVVVKPTSSIGIEQDTYDFEDNKVAPLIVHGRHDACITLRVPVVVEAMTAIVLCDFSRM